MLIQLKNAFWQCNFRLIIWRSVYDHRGRSVPFDAALIRKGKLNSMKITNIQCTYELIDPITQLFICYLDLWTNRLKRYSKFLMRQVWKRKLSKFLTEQINCRILYHDKKGSSRFMFGLRILFLTNSFLHASNNWLQKNCVL